MELILLIFLLFWFFHFLRRSFFWFYFWQLKEYRFDRFLDGIKENKKILFPKISLFACILLLLYSLFLRKDFLFESLIFSLYFFFGFYSIISFFKKEWILPVFTKKMTFLFISWLFLFSILIFIFLNHFLFFFFVLSFEIFFPLFISLFGGLTQIPIFFLKRKIIKKAKEKREKFKDLIVIGIAGSYGKTSTKEFLAELLSGKYNVLKTKGNRNTEIAIAQTIIKDLKPEHQVFVSETGTYRIGEVKAICDIIKQKIGILTGISFQHISLFGSLKNIIKGEYEIISSLSPDGIAIFNVANKKCEKLAKRTILKKYLYSLEKKEGIDIWAENIKEEKDFLEFDLTTKEKTERIRLNLLGVQNIENFLGAAICALELGLSFSEIKERALKIKAPETTMRKTEGKRKTIIIDDSYSANVEGVLAALNYLKNYQGKRIIIMPCLIELGKHAPSSHKLIGEKIGEICDLAIITTPYYFKEIKLGVTEKGMPDKKIIFSNNPKRISEILKPYFQKENVILIEGKISKEIKKLILED